MKTTIISEHGIQLTRYGFVNCYLVRETAPDGDSFTLIDTGLSGSEQDIIAAARAAGAPIKRILLTHAHVDHVGSVDALSAALPGVSLAATERSVPLLRQPPDKKRLPGEPKDSFGGGLPGISTPITHFIEDGELYGSLRAVFTPGHIPGHVSFLDERDGTLYAGDELLCFGKLCVCGWTPWYFPFPSFIMWSKPLAAQSARKLLDYPIQRFASGHGPLREGGIEALRAAVAATE